MRQSTHHDFAVLGSQMLHRIPYKAKTGIWQPYLQELLSLGCRVAHVGMLPRDQKLCVQKHPFQESCCLNTKQGQRRRGARIQVAKKHKTEYSPRAIEHPARPKSELMCLRLRLKLRWRSGRSICTNSSLNSVAARRCSAAGGY